MSDTPRTDAQAFNYDGSVKTSGALVEAHFARNLERELRATIQERRDATESLRNWITKAEGDALLIGRLERELAESKMNADNLLTMAQFWRAKWAEATEARR